MPFCFNFDPNFDRPKRPVSALPPQAKWPTSLAAICWQSACRMLTDVCNLPKLFAQMCIRFCLYHQFPFAPCERLGNARWSWLKIPNLNSTSRTSAFPTRRGIHLSVFIIQNFRSTTKIAQTLVIRRRLLRRIGDSPMESAKLDRLVLRVVWPVQELSRSSKTQVENVSRRAKWKF